MQRNAKQEEPKMKTAWPIVLRRPHEHMHPHWFRATGERLFHRRLKYSTLASVVCTRVKRRIFHRETWRWRSQTKRNGDFLVYNSTDKSSISRTHGRSPSCTQQQACSNEPTWRKRFGFSANTTGWRQLLNNNKLTEEITWRHILYLCFL